MYNSNFEQYLKDSDRTSEDFYCRTCGEYMLDDSAILDFRVRIKKDGSKIMTYKRVHYNSGLIEPKRFSADISLYRHTCWNCYFRMRSESTDVNKKRLKSKVYDGNNIPRPNVLMPDFYLIYDISADYLRSVTKSKYDSASKSSFIERFGVDEGSRKYVEYCDRQGYTASSEYFIKEKGMTAADVDAYHKSRAVTLENLVKRYGKRDGAKRYAEYCDRQSYAGCKLEYFIERLGKIEGRKKWMEINLAKVKGSSSQYIDKSHSKISMKLFTEIASPESRYGLNETMLVSPESGNIYFADFHNPSTNKIIEFFGDYWHGNPAKYSNDDVVGDNLIAEDVWEKDKKRLDNILELGYHVMIVWERDFKQDPEGVIKKCMAFLYD